MLNRFRISFLFIPFFVIVALGVFSYTVKQVSPKVASACTAENFTGLIDPQDKIAVFEGKRFQVNSELASKQSQRSNVLGVYSGGEKWIEVDLSEQKLRAWEGSQLFLETPVSTGLPWWPTPQGEFRIWVKLRATKMEGGTGRYYYYLPNVPFVMYFENDQIPGWRGYGLHGTYWHNDFGTPRSHGCVNLPTPVAEKLYYWADPVLPNGKSSVYADEANRGTRIVIHE